MSGDALPISVSQDDELAAVLAVIEILSTPRADVREDSDVTPAWRFSGRWFADDRRSI